MICEVCVDSLASAAAAVLGGAHRLELCSALSEGGLTPTPGLVEAIVERAGIPVHAMLRPRGGDFCYDEAEFSLMRRDLAWLRRSGVRGVVLGALTGQGAIDKEQVKRLVDESFPLSVTFHRAFDGCAHPFETLELLVELGIERLLTSGQQPDAYAGRELIRQLIVRAAGRMIVMPGGGISPENIRVLLAHTGAGEIHFSASSWHESRSSGPAGSGRRITSPEKVSEMIALAAAW